MVRLELMVESGGRGSSHETEVSDEVHLVVVAGGVGDLGPGDALVARASLEAQSINKLGDAGHGLRCHAREFQGLPFELAGTDVEGCGELTDSMCAAVLSNEGERLGPVGVAHLVAGGEPLEQELVEQADAAAERASLAEGTVELRDGSAKEGVGFDRVFGKELGGYAEELTEAERLEHDGERFDCAVGGQLQATVGDGPDDEHGSAGLESVCADDGNAIEAGEVKFEEAAKACRDGLLKIVSRDNAALRVVAHEGAQRRMRRGGRKINAYPFHLVLKGNLMGSTLWRSC